MNLPTIFNIAIGLIFIYLVLSLLASQIQEVIATILEWRAEQLTRAIENLVLGDTDTESKTNNEKTYDLVDNLFKNPLVRNLNQTSKSWIATIPKKIISLLATIPTIQKFIPQDKEPNRNTINPTYIAAETFSTTILYELGIPRLGRFLTWLNIEKLIYNEIYLKIDTLLVEGKECKSLKIDKSFEPYKNLQSHFKHVLEDYKQERYGLSSTIVRLRNQVENFKREIEETLPTKSSTDSETLESEESHARKTLKDLITRIVEFVFTPDKNDQDLIIRLRPSLTTLLDLLNKDSNAYKSCEEEFPKASPLRKSFEFVQIEFNKVSKILPESLRKSLYELALRSRIKASDIENQLDNFKQEIETWFDRSMDRASGVYKRNARGFAFLIGLVLAVSLNADTFYMVSRLSKDDALRNSIVSSSTQLFQNVQSPNPLPTSIVTTSPNTIEKVKDSVDQSLSEITLPVGWNDNILDEQFQIPDPIKEDETSVEKQKREKQQKEKERRQAKFLGHPIHPVIIMITGWLITATAIMMGAPFWFDFLGLFINVRNTGSKPASKANKK